MVQVKETLEMGDRWLGSFLAGSAISEVAFVDNGGTLASQYVCANNGSQPPTLKLSAEYQEESMRKLLIVMIGIVMLILASTPILLAQDGVQSLLEENSIYLPIIRNDPPGTVPLR